MFALLLELCQHVAKHAEAVRAGEWTNQPDFALRKTPLFELAGKTMGIVGLGRIGECRWPRWPRAFGMKVIASTSFPAGSTSGVARSNGAIWTTFAPVRRDQPALSADAADGRAGESRTAEPMKPTAFLINTARGPLSSKRTWPRR